MLPVRYEGEVCVLTADPAEVSGREDLALLLSEELTPVIAPRELILRSIEQCYVSQDVSPGDFLKNLEADQHGEGESIGRGGEDLLQISEGAPVTHLVNLILLEAVKARASDIHFEPFDKRLRVRYRIDGRLYEQAAPPKHMELALTSRLKVMARMDIAEKRLPQDGMARVHVGEKEIDIRVSTVPVAEGERVVLRLLDRDSSLLPLSALGMPDAVLSSFERILEQSYGLVLVTGPTGSGKTTSLYAALGQLDSQSLNIMTIEDPIEYKLESVSQIQVKPKIGLTFGNGLRHILRQDPDVVLVGETRDLETAETAARSSLTGHLVFSTLHTNDAPSAVVRMIDMGIEPYLLAASLRAIMAQRLVRRLCDHCKKPVEDIKQRIGALGSAGEALAGADIFDPVGCGHCLGGYKGRVGIYELMIVDVEAQDIIRSGSINLDGLKASAESRGMVDLLADGVSKVRQGMTSLSEVMRVLGRQDDQ
jgi:general secretion pathway protein E